jgi:hypothetical protein
MDTWFLKAGTGCPPFKAGPYRRFEPAGRLDPCQATTKPRLGPRWATLAACWVGVAWAGGRNQKHGPAFGVGCKAGPYRATNSRFTWSDGDNGDMAKVVPANPCALKESEQYLAPKNRNGLRTHALKESSLMRAGTCSKRSVRRSWRAVFSETVLSNRHPPSTQVQPTLRIGVTARWGCTWIRVKRLSRCSR